MADWWWMAALVLGQAVAGEPAAPPTAAISYVIEAAPAKGESLSTRFSSSQLAILEMLNRADAGRLAGLPALVIPESWHDDPLAYSPFPRRYEWRADAPKLQLVRWAPTSTGRESLPTPAGLFHLTWRSKGRHSTVNASWFMPWYFNFHNDLGLSFHEYALPGLPASHACARLLERDAQWLYEWGESWTLDERGWNVLDPGTPTLFLNCYAFGEPPPWRSLDWLRRGVSLPTQPDLSERECPGR